MRFVNLYDSQIPAEGRTILGIFYPNGIFSEVQEEKGITYIVDHLLYEMLQQTIGDTGRGIVSGKTYYGYSEFIVDSPTNLANSNLAVIREILYERPWTNEGLFLWIQSRREICRTYHTPLENQYYSKCLPESPLAKTLSAGLKCDPSWEQIHVWRKRYITPDYVICCIMGDCSEIEPVQEDGILLCNSLPVFSPNKIIPPKHYPWNYSNLIYSIPFTLSSANIIAAEACCQILRTALSSVVNAEGGKLCRIAFYPDYISELRIHVQAKRGSEWNLVNRIVCSLANQGTPSLKQVEEIKRNIYSFYCNLRLDPREWIRFSGYNLMSGNRYRLSDLCNESAYDVYLTQDSVHDVLSVLQHEVSHQIFISAAR